jgi:hypothetical protein
MTSLSSGLRHRRSTILPHHSPQTTPLKRRKRARPTALIYVIPSCFLICFIFVLSKPSHRRLKSKIRKDTSLTNMDIAENLKTHIDSMVKRQSVILCEDQSQGILNDDYCDCHDGRDEPNTAACSHILIHKASFRCKDGSSLLFPSRVGDGIKDCPDGSDELLSISYR